ncbi:hypothetical protein [Paraburkholderia caffeinilytica]|uniref:hypothetical protein n=1 Tax=Paraburkholderia caffeinilytica TaxID=1761016 RepID=UPI0038B74DB0
MSSQAGCDTSSSSRRGFFDGVKYLQMPQYRSEARMRNFSNEGQIFDLGRLKFVGGMRTQFGRTQQKTPAALRRRGFEFALKNIARIAYMFSINT